MWGGTYGTSLLVASIGSTEEGLGSERGTLCKTALEMRGSEPTGQEAGLLAHWRPQRGLSSGTTAWCVSLAMSSCADARVLLVEKRI